jgi:hypothetical protein
MILDRALTWLLTVVYTFNIAGIDSSYKALSKAKKSVVQKVCFGIVTTDSKSSVQSQLS